MVEPPGIAPGSGPLITSAFIAISEASSGKPNIGRIALPSKLPTENSVEPGKKQIGLGQKPPMNMYRISWPYHQDHYIQLKPMRPVWY